MQQNEMETLLLLLLLYMLYVINSQRRSRGWAIEDNPGLRDPSTQGQDITAGGHLCPDDNLHSGSEAYQLAHLHEDFDRLR